MRDRRWNLVSLRGRRTTACLVTRLSLNTFCLCTVPFPFELSFVQPSCHCPECPLHKNSTVDSSWKGDLCKDYLRMTRLIQHQHLPLKSDLLESPTMCTSQAPFLAQTDRVRSNGIPDGGCDPYISKETGRFYMGEIERLRKQYHVRVIVYIYYIMKYILWGLPRLRLSGAAAHVGVLFACQVVYGDYYLPVTMGEDDSPQPSMHSMEVTFSLLSGQSLKLTLSQEPQKIFLVSGIRSPRMKFQLETLPVVPCLTSFYCSICQPHVQVKQLNNSSK